MRGSSRRDLPTPGLGAGHGDGRRRRPRSRTVGSVPLGAGSVETGSGTAGGVGSVAVPAGSMSGAVARARLWVLVPLGAGPARDGFGYRRRRRHGCGAGRIDVRFRCSRRCGFVARRGRRCGFGRRGGVPFGAGGDRRGRRPGCRSARPNRCPVDSGRGPGVAQIDDGGCWRHNDGIFRRCRSPRRRAPERHGEAQSGDRRDHIRRHQLHDWSQTTPRPAWAGPIGTGRSYGHDHHDPPELFNLINDDCEPPRALRRLRCVSCVTSLVQCAAGSTRGFGRRVGV